MPIQVKCSCGKALRVKDELAGKLVKCPGCSEKLRVPQQAAGAADKIRVKCECGKTLAVSGKLAGKKVKCPGCAKVLAVPGPGAPPSAEPELKPPASDDLALGFKGDCPSCGAQVEDGVVTCPHCGVNTETGEKPAPAGDAEGDQCPKCGTPVQEGTNLCLQCGMSLALGKKERRKKGGLLPRKIGLVAGAAAAVMALAFGGWFLFGRTASVSDVGVVPDFIARVLPAETLVVLAGDWKQLIKESWFREQLSPKPKPDEEGSDKSPQAGMQPSLSLSTVADPELASEFLDAVGIDPASNLSWFRLGVFVGDNPDKPSFVAILTGSFKKVAVAEKLGPIFEKKDQRLSKEEHLGYELAVAGSRLPIGPTAGFAAMMARGGKVPKGQCGCFAFLAKGQFVIGNYDGVKQVIEVKEGKEANLTTNPNYGKVKDLGDQSAQFGLAVIAPRDVEKFVKRMERGGQAEETPEEVKEFSAGVIALDYTEAKGLALGVTALFKNEELPGKCKEKLDSLIGKAKKAPGDAGSAVSDVLDGLAISADGPKLLAKLVVKPASAEKLPGAVMAMFMTAMMEARAVAAKAVEDSKGELDAGWTATAPDFAPVGLASSEPGEASQPSTLPSVPTEPTVAIAPATGVAEPGKEVGKPLPPAVPPPPPEPPAERPAETPTVAEKPPIERPEPPPIEKPEEPPEKARSGPKDIRAGDKVKITIGPAPVKVGQETVATLRAGTILTALAVEKRNVQVKVVGRDGKDVEGWVSIRQMRLAKPDGR